MNDELRKKLAEDLKNAGFSAEMMTLRAFLQSGWAAEGGAGFLDRDEGKMRDIDVVAHQEIDDEEFPINCTIDIHAEVKKSATPWILFRNRPRFFHRLVPLFWGTVTSPPDYEPPWYNVCDGAVLDGAQWAAYGLHEAFKRPDQPSRGYAAFLSAAKASDQHIEDLKTWEKENPVDELPPDLPPGGLLILAQPLVVLDGILAVAELDANGEVIVEEIDMATFRLVYMSPAYRRARYDVDIVTLAALDRYIEKANIYHKRLMARYREMAVRAQAARVPSSAGSKQ